MSGFGTKKLYADLYQQLGFPAVFSEVYADERMPLEYAPTQFVYTTSIPVGTDLQATYHRQKQIDADNMVRAKVQATRNMDYRYLHGPHGYFNLPRPVLTQRVFANPSNGNQADIYPARRDVMYNGLHGGVLRSAEGQAYGRMKLRGRVNQLNAIEAAKAGLLTGDTLAEELAPVVIETQVSQGVPVETTKNKLELVALLNEIASSVQLGSLSQLDFKSIVRFLFLLFREASTMTRQELEEIFESVDTLLVDLRSAVVAAEPSMDADYEEEVQSRLDGRLESAYSMMAKSREYLRKMLSIVNKSPKERRDASKAFVKTLGFTSAIFNKDLKTPEALRLLAKEKQNQEAQRERLENPERGIYETDFRDDDPFFPSPLSRNVIGTEYTQSQKEAVSGKRLLVRKIKPRRPKVAFDPSPRERFGDRSGAYAGEEAPSDESMMVRNPFRATEVEEARLPEGEAEQVEPTFSSASNAGRERVAAQVEYNYPDGDAITRYNLPRTIAGLRDLADWLDETYSIRIIVRDDSKLTNVKKNFVKRLGL
jgi:hypothetical protein